MSRFGRFDFDTTGGKLGVKFTLVVDGQEDWDFTWIKGEEVAIAT